MTATKIRMFPEFHNNQARLSAAAKCRYCRAIWETFSNDFCEMHSPQGWKDNIRTPTKPPQERSRVRPIGSRTQSLCSNCGRVRVPKRGLQLCADCYRPEWFTRGNPSREELERGRKRTPRWQWQCLDCGHSFELRCRGVDVPKEWWLPSVQRKFAKPFEKLPWACTGCGSSAHTVPK